MEKYKITNDGGEVTMVDFASGVTLKFFDGDADTITTSAGTATAVEYTVISGEMIDYAYSTGLLSEMSRKHIIKQEYRRIIGNTIKERRTALNMPIRALAERSRIAVGTISNIENGRFSASLDVLIPIAEALGLELILREKLKEKE